MARPKANADTRFYAALRTEFLLDEYLKTHDLPLGWGQNVNLRRFNAGLLVQFSQRPELLSIPQSVFNTGPDLHRDLPRQILFSRLFAAAPDDFLAFATYFRQVASAGPQAETVAMIMLVEGDRLLRSPTGDVRSDKEIAIELWERKYFGLAGMHTSVIGKARALIAHWYDEERRGRIARYLEEAPPLLAWLDERRLAADGQESFLGN